MSSPAPAGARFVSGSTTRHVVVMASTGAVGLMAVFAVDLINLFYISLLGEKEIAAAVGFAGVVGFFHTSVSIGLTIGISAVVSRHRLLGRFERAQFAADARRLAQVAAPALLTNLATPVGAAFVTHSIAQFGPAAVAGQATIDRLTPVAFGIVYALSGAVGPILAQNLGARQYERVRQGLRDSLLFMVMAVGLAWAVLALAQHALVRAFSAQGQAAELIHVFCSWLAAGFFFVGALFVANAAFNNLGRPLWSTAFNWMRATLGTIPFAWWGSRYGPIGVIAGQALGTAVFGTLALVFAFRLTARLAPREDGEAASPEASALSAASHTALAPVVEPAQTVRGSLSN